MANIWQQGGLRGETSSPAFAVIVGLGTSVTADHIVAGYLRIVIQVALVQPNEFIVFSVRQTQAQPA